MGLEFEYYKYKDKYYMVEVSDEFVIGYNEINKYEVVGQADTIDDKQWDNIINNYKKYIVWQKKGENN
jgi:hypothetical protein